MTCQYTTTQWRDAINNAVRAADGDVEAAALFLTTRRNVSMHPESLRRKLRGGDQLDVEVAVLLGEFLSKDVEAQPCSEGWLLSLCAQEGLHVDDVPPAPDGGWECEARALQDKFMPISAKVGKIAAVTAQTTADGVVDQNEADQLVPLFREARVLLHRMERQVFVLHGARARQNAGVIIMSAAEDWKVEIKQKGRTSSQNAFSHAWYGEIASVLRDDDATLPGICCAMVKGGFACRLKVARTPSRVPGKPRHLAR